MDGKTVPVDPTNCNPLDLDEVIVALSKVLRLAMRVPVSRED
jgi:hypothetical protein